MIDSVDNTHGSCRRHHRLQHYDTAAAAENQEKEGNFLEFGSIS